MDLVVVVGEAEAEREDAVVHHLEDELVRHPPVRLQCVRGLDLMPVSIHFSPQSIAAVFLIYAGMTPIPCEKSFS